MPTQFFRVDENKYIMIFLIGVLYFPEKFMFDHTGFSIYNESGSKHILKLPWLKHFND